MSDASKLEELAAIEGLEVDELLDEYGNEAVMPGICVNDGCDCVNDSVEPDCYDGYCEECETDTVKSVLALAGVI